MLTLDSKFKDHLKERLPSVSEKSAAAVLELHKEGGTVPFIARYRKERTGNLDEVKIREILETHEQWLELNKRRDFILAEIEKQGNLTDELKQRILATKELGDLEELYRPYKRKKKTKATLAREAGLGRLADWIWRLGEGSLKDSTTLEVKAKDFINPTAGYATYQEALRGAQHIIVERLSNMPDLRERVREEYLKNGKVVSQKTTKFKPNSKFDMYADFKEDISTLKQRKASHRYLALKRGWQEGELKVSMEADDEKLLKDFEQKACSARGHQAENFLKECAKISLNVHVIPSISNELHRQLKELAEDFAIDVFAENVRKVLMSSPYGQRVILGVDPGLKTGCKVALIDQNGNFISHTVLKILGDEAKEKGKKLLGEVAKQVKIGAIAVGNGTGGREAQRFISGVLKELGHDIPVIMVNEAGASVYSASEVAREEFPDLDITVRGAISIARRLQDPISELVKIEPKSIGVGQYQHDMNQVKLRKTLHGVVESCVNNVGVNLNTASKSLLQYVAGIGPALAEKIVEYRKQVGDYKELNDLLKVPQFSSKAFEQSAGFLRIYNGISPLDQTGVHPESYTVVKDMAKEVKLGIRDLLGEGANRLTDLRDRWKELVGEFTFDDIVRELKKPGRDPRGDYQLFQYRDDINEVADLEEKMICPGVVTNVTNFGAFVDIGVHQDGLVHISHLSHQFVDDPRKVVSPGDQVKVKVLSVDKDKNQISLSMLLTEKPSVSARAGKGRKAQKADSKGASKKRTRKGGGPKNKGPRGKGPKRPRQSTPFNNPFASLSGLKSGE